MKKSTYKTITYEMGKGWMLDITEHNDEREAWIFNTRIGIKSMMFRKNITDDSFEQFLNMAV